MPRAGLDTATVVAAAADLADEVGLPQLTMGLVAERLGVRAPSLYKHVTGQDDLNRRIAALSLAEAAEAIGTAIQGRAGREALAAAMRAYRTYVLAHPGRYLATISVVPRDEQDPIAVARGRQLAVLDAVLRSYPVEPGELAHARRAVRSVMHGFASLQAAHGFQWSADVDESYEWLITFTDRALRA